MSAWRWSGAGHGPGSAKGLGRSSVFWTLLPGETNRGRIGCIESPVKEDCFAAATSTLTGMRQTHPPACTPWGPRLYEVCWCFEHLN